MVKLLKRNNTVKSVSKLQVGAAFVIIAIFIAVTFIFSLSKGSINISAGDI